MGDVRSDYRLVSIRQGENLAARKLLRIPQLNLERPNENKAPSANANPSEVRRRAKNPAAARNPTAPNTHHDVGRHAYSPTAIPAPKANAAHSNGRRGGLIGGENGVANFLGNTSLFVIANCERLWLSDFEVT